MNKSLLLTVGVSVVVLSAVVLGNPKSPPLLSKSSELIVDTVDVPKLAPVAEPFKMHKQIKYITVDNNQVIRLTGEVGPETRNIIPQIDKLNDDTSVSEIYLLIDSPGGSIADGAKIVSAIEASPKPIYTVCVGMCASMASIIHQYGKTRFMTDRSMLMFHDASGTVQGHFAQMRTRLAFIDRLFLKMITFAAVRSGADPKEFIINLDRESWVDAEDSTQRHLNDGLVYIHVKGGAPIVDVMPTDKLHLLTPSVEAPSVTQFLTTFKN